MIQVSIVFKLFGLSLSIFELLFMSLPVLDVKLIEKVFKTVLAKYYFVEKFIQKRNTREFY